MSACRQHGKVPLSSLHLCVPPLRLLAAFMWQVVKQRRVKYYNRLEKFVSVVLEVLPDLLIAKERTELLLGLRTMFILDICRDQPSVKLQIMQTHLDRLHRIDVSATDGSGDPVVDAAVRNFVDLIQTILRSPQEKKHFFQEVYPLHYGPKYDTALQSLVWEFLCRLEKRLPVPSFHQMASWFDEDPLYLENSLQIEPQKVKNVLQYVKHFGHSEQESPPSPIFANTILSTMSVSNTPLPATCEQTDSEKCASTLHESQTSVNEGDRQVYEDFVGRMVNDEDTHGDVNEDYIQRNLNDEDPQTDMDKTHSTEQEEENTGLHGYSSESQESTDHSSSETRVPPSSGSGAGVFSPSSSSLKTASQGSRTAVSTARKPQKHACPERGKTCPKPGLAGPSQTTKKCVTVAPKIAGGYICSFCCVEFKNMSGLKTHLTIHTGERPHLCSYCGRAFRTKSILTGHTRVHTGERPYVCSLCGRRFIQKSGLVAHERLHTGERPYVCSFCGKGFPAPGALLIHTRFHTGERPYKCEVCKKGFMQMCNLVEHRRRHTKEKPYPCTVCDKRFTMRNQVNRHMKVHTR
ncbi:zinc finger protein 432-like isoform X2 [Alosa sapidissima]|uniref:zinc finger protein 432-like isoform X2 n=1 Tax=Alosa sapidissima TaxID=34773 RepID=UPI001C08FDE7|nr:zinc finger protein 432-like isoform X2 [Alosa sapidissima]